MHKGLIFFVSGSFIVEKIALGFVTYYNEGGGGVVVVVVVIISSSLFFVFISL